MQSRWNDAEARAFVDRHAAVGADLALRVYTSRLIGSEPDLVLHGGGNTSVKTWARTALGDELEVLCIKGSGADLAFVEPAGLPAVELGPLLRLRALPRLDDVAMVQELRRRLLDPGAPNPSVEALLHAFLPHRFVDHTHADAILALGNQVDGERRVREVFGDDVAILPWTMPGFPLAKAVADAYERRPDCQGIVLLHHGIFTFGDDARQSYQRMIHLVDRAEQFVRSKVGAVAPLLRGDPAPQSAAARREVFAALLPRLRGLTALGDGSGERFVRTVADVRDGDALAAFAAQPAADALCASGPITPDHILRTKGRYLYVARAEAGDRTALERRIADYVGWYRDYFKRCAAPLGATVMLAPMPVVAVVEGCGLCAIAPTKLAATIAADIAEHTVAVWAQGHALGHYHGLGEPELAAMEYWALERAKLGRQAAPLLAGQIAFVTGAAGAIGHAVAAALLQHGACVCLVDRDAERLAAVVERLAAHRRQLTTVIADLCDPAQVRAAFAHCVQAFGGVDLIIPSHGVAHVDRIERLDVQRFRSVLDVNATAVLLVLQEAAKILRAQATGGGVVLQVSKNAFAPGAGFGAYSASKAAALQLGRIAALEFAEFGVRVNMVNADAVFGDDAVPSQLWAEVGPDRMRARGLDAAGLRAFYRDRSLLKRTVTPQHVADAVLFLLAHAGATTGAVLPVDGGLPEAFPR